MVKLLLTSMGIVTTNICNEFFRLCEKNKEEIRLFLVTTAKKTDEDWKFVESVVSDLEGIGLLRENIIIFSLDKTIEDKDLMDIDVIHICGGNTFHYLDGIRKTGLIDKVVPLVERGVLYVGVSAGSILAGPNIEIASPYDDNDINLSNLDGFHLTDTIISPHFIEEERETIENFKKKKNCDVFLLTDPQAISIEDDVMKLIE